MNRLRAETDTVYAQIHVEESNALFGHVAYNRRPIIEHALKPQNQGGGPKARSRSD